MENPAKTIPKFAFPPPWKLTGRALIISGLFPKSWFEQEKVFGQAWPHEFKGGLGYLMLIDYQSSPVGPYKELLLIPGKFRVRGKKYQSIARIYVDSPQSLQGGRENWCIPKYLADFDWVEKENSIHIGVSVAGKELLKVNASYGGLRFPMTTSLLPIHLYQEWEGKAATVRPSGKGRAKLARIHSLTSSGEGFPRLEQAKKLISMWVEPFEMHFPAGKFEL